MPFQNKVVVVTGAAAGIGKATAELFAHKGSQVVIADYDEEKGDRAAEEISQKARGEAHFFKVDVSNKTEVDQLIEETISKYEEINILVNNAGIHRTGDVVSTSEDTWKQVLNVNLTGMFLTMKFAVPHMKENGGGTIVNVASEAGVVGIKGQVAYDVSKAGVISLTQSAALDHASDNIRVNCIAPGTTFTPLVEKHVSESPDPDEAKRKLEQARPMNRLGKPKEIAEAILFLASDSSAYATGSVLNVDGGYTAQ